ncbi:MAG: type II asparaginase [Acidobacteriota bacterium]|nr:type II asparaginase [Acidobacteriota bacterium]
MTTRPRIAILATGGTIAGASPSATGSSYTAGGLPVDALLAAVPQLRELADLSAEKLAAIGSQDVGDALWLELAARVTELTAGERVDGVVITSGTDTIEETAFFLHLVVHTARPIVLTGAMRPASSLSADGPLNLYNAVAVAADPRARGKGVLVVANDKIHGARSVVKANTTVVDTLQSPGRGLIGTVHFGEARYFRGPVHSHTEQTPFSVAGVAALPRVDVVYAHAGMDGKMVAAAVANGARGIVLAGVGSGNLSATALEALTAAAAGGVACVRSTRLPTGFVARNVEIDDDARGLIAAYELSPQKARVLLQLCLLDERSPAEIQELFLEF